MVQKCSTAAGSGVSCISMRILQACKSHDHAIVNTMIYSNAVMTVSNIYSVSPLPYVNRLPTNEEDLPYFEEFWQKKSRHTIDYTMTSPK